ncbi:MAG: gliding motility-associated C-terminal domain-containing protein, partial [Flavobacteriales bacterium]|nr:gliding motility-associated C-terminal domain-containing protein [Flavobacteriales bacterium]
SCETLERTVNVVASECGCNIYAPNSFTPDNDNINEIWKVVAECEFESYALRVFNRWGEMVFFSEDPSIGWNGDSGTGYFAGNDIYQFILQYELTNDENFIQELTGHITLMR